MTETTASYRTRYETIWGGLFIAVSVATGVAIVAVLRERIGELPLLAAIPVVGFGVLGYCVFLRPRVLVGPSSVLVRNPFVRHVLAYQDIQAARTFGTFVGLSMRDGTVIHSSALRTSRYGLLFEQRTAERMVADVTARLDRYRADPPAGRTAVTAYRRPDWPSIAVAVACAALIGLVHVL